MTHFYCPFIKFIVSLSYLGLLLFKCGLELSEVYYGLSPLFESISSTRPKNSQDQNEPFQAILGTLFVTGIYLGLGNGNFFSSRIISFGRGPLPINLITTTQKEKDPFVTYKTINIHVHIYFFIRETAPESIQLITSGANEQKINSIFRRTNR